VSEIPFVNRLGDEIERAVTVASRPTSRRSRWLSTVSRRWIPSVLVLGSSLIVVAVVAVALVLHHSPPGRGAPTQPGRAIQRPSQTQPELASSTRQLVSDYSVLRAPQTAADRVKPGRLGTTVQAFGPGGASVISRATAVPSLTRVVTSDGVRVSLFVVRMTPVRVVPASANSTAAGRRLEASFGGYALRVRISGGGSQLVGLAPSSISPVSGMTAFPAPGGRDITVVPDGVAHVRWSWPRLLNPTTLTYTPAHSVLAPARHNLVIAPVTGLNPPPTAAWYAPDGRIIAVIHNPDARGEQYGVGLSRPAPATPQSRQAEQDPATPNKVIISPATGSMNTMFRVLFHVLVNHQRYGYRITDSPRPGCITASSRSNRLVGPSTNLRGDLFQGILQGAVSCAGTYRVSVYMLDRHGRAYAAFGSATLSVR
jgi:hypothetical protein